MTMAKMIYLGLLAVAFGAHPTCAAEGAPQSVKLSSPSAGNDGLVALSPPGVVRVRTSSFRYAAWGHEIASIDARSIADWVVDSGDSRDMPFIVIDKIDAKVFVFDAAGGLRGAAPALLGLALGDVAVPGIGKRALSKILPEERTTPAGRFEAALGRNLAGKEILWVDYDGAVSLHPVISTKLKEHRLERLASLTPLDNRISYGCINVSARFFDQVVRPAFSGTNGIVYVLPETRSIQKEFGSYDVSEQERRQTEIPRSSLSAVPPAPTFNGSSK